MSQIVEMMTDLLIAAVLTGCLTSWVVVLLRKWQVLEWLQVHGGRLISEMAGCDYCMNWWLSWVVAVPAALLTGCWWLLLTPFFSTMVGRMLSM